MGISLLNSLNRSPAKYPALFVPARCIEADHVCCSLGWYAEDSPADAKDAGNADQLNDLCSACGSTNTECPAAYRNRPKKLPLPFGSYLSTCLEAAAKTNLRIIFPLTLS